MGRYAKPTHAAGEKVPVARGADFNYSRYLYGTWNDTTNTVFTAPYNSFVNGIDHVFPMASSIDHDIVLRAQDVDLCYAINVSTNGVSNNETMEPLTLGYYFSNEYVYHNKEVVSRYDIATLYDAWWFTCGLIGCENSTSTKLCYNIYNSQNGEHPPRAIKINLRPVCKYSMGSATNYIDTNFQETINDVEFITTYIGTSYNLLDTCSDYLNSTYGTVFGKAFNSSSTLKYVIYTYLSTAYLAYGVYNSNNEILLVRATISALYINLSDGWMLQEGATADSSGDNLYNNDSTGGNHVYVIQNTNGYKSSTQMLDFPYVNDNWAWLHGHSLSVSCGRSLVTLYVYANYPNNLKFSINLNNLSYARWVYLKNLRP